MQMRKLTWVNFVQIAAPFVAVIFYAGIVRSDVSDNTAINDAQQARILAAERKITQIETNYEHILRKLDDIKEEIEKK